VRRFQEFQYCAACGNKLFRSEPNSLVAVAGRVFFEQENKNVIYKRQLSGVQRTEALCGRCDGHLVIFDDGPAPTGKKRYCMNLSYDFYP
jgi:peptide methionine sulfoxide reductase MsrB